MKDRANLDALMLLTLADGQGTSDEAWSDWKESLVWQLYHATARYLADGEAGYLADRRERETPARGRRGGARRQLRRRDRRAFPRDARALFRDVRRAGHRRAPAAHAAIPRLPPRTRRPDAALAPAIRWNPQPERGHTECWVCTWERRGLFAKIAGSFAAAGLNILSADIYTRDDNMAFDVFRVSDARRNAP